MSALEAVNIEIRGQRATVLVPTNQIVRQKTFDGIVAGTEYPLGDPPKLEIARIFDVGANIGASALYFSANYPDAAVHCFEPMVANIGTLRENTSSIRGVEVHGFALGACDEERPLFHGRMTTDQASLYQHGNTAWGSFESVIVRDAAREVDACGGLCNALLKIDAEGSEVPILRSLGDRLAQVSIVFVEYHSESCRIVIDELLRPHACVFHAQADRPHRGTLGYVAKRIMRDSPQLGFEQIDIGT